MIKNNTPAYRLVHILKNPLIVNLFSVRNDIAAKGKLYTYNKLGINIKTTARCEAIQIIAQYQVIFVAQVDFKCGLFVFVKHFKLVPDAKRNKWSLAV